MMEKVDLTFALNEDARKWKEETYQALLKNKHIQDWLKKYQKEDRFIYEHVGKFKDWLTTIEKCDHCQGLAFCRQEIPGQFMDVYDDGFLDIGLHRCNFYKQHVNELEHGSYYLEPKVSESQLKINIANLDLTKESNDYKLVIKDILTLIKNENPKKGLYLWGKPGVGKTYLAIGILNHYTKKKQRCAFINVPNLISDLKMMFHDADASRMKLRQLRDVGVLVLDDIGGESVTAWSRDEVILPLLDYRMEHKKLTFFTSNYSFDDLKERLTTTSNKVSEPMAAERVLERIRTLACEDFVKGDSRRQ